MPEVLERCVEKVMGEGHDKESAYAICRTSLGLAADGADDKKELSLTDEALDVALKPHLAPKKTESRIVNFALADEIEDDIGTDAHIIETLENGDVMKEVPLALMGKDFKNGPHSFDFTEENLAVIIRNFETRGQPIPITIGHYPEEERQRQPAAAWIHKLFSRDGKLWGLVRFLRATWSDIREGKFKGFSMEFWTESTDVHGNEIGMQIDGGALTNYPFFPVRVDNARQGHSLITLTAFTGHHTAAGEGRPKVAEDKKVEEPKKIEPIEKDGQRVTLSQRFFEDHYEKAVTQSEEMRGELATIKADAEAKGRKIQKLENELLGRRIQVAVKDLQVEGVVVPLGDYAIFTNHNEAISWLASSPAPFYVNTIEGLEKLVQDKAATAHLRKLNRDGVGSSGRIEETALATDDEARKVATKEGREEVFQLRKRAFRLKYQSHEIALIERRPGGFDAFVKADLQADYPSVKFE
jgi:hypothetical protein